MRALLAAMNCAKGDLAGNLASHLTLLRAAAPGDLILFPEMSLTGYVDPVSSSNWLAGLKDASVTQLIAATGEAGVCACFGIAERSPDGQPHITQIVAAEGKLLGIQRKRYLGEGEDAFTPAEGNAVFDYGGTRFGVAICAEAGHDAPFNAAADAGATLVLFPAAPGLYGRRTDEASWRAGFSWWEDCSLGDASRHARRLRLWIAQAGQAGATVDEDFPGLAALTGPDGTVVDRLPDWNPGVLTVNIGNDD
ncbi:MAG TPA: carbon-nitrogen hydrolase family protein [Streptosporangiaceae bacterium]|nr:carbon-nitrogen hydrolase family protein [Streptosporangiaceae bacterium]